MHHPDALRLSASQIADWQIYHDLEPWGEFRQDFRAGQICAAVANYAGKSRSDEAGLAHPVDFMPGLREFFPDRTDEPVLLADPAAQARLIRQRLFRAED